VKWFNIGLKLGISPSTLNAIKKKNSQDPDNCLTDMLEYWLNNGKPKPSWEAVANALKSRMVGYAQLAEQLPQQNTYCVDTGHSSSSSIKGKHSRSYSEGEGTPVAKKNKL
jgi:hypothetical protein